MLIEELNKVKDMFYIDNNNIEEIVKTGEVGLYKSIFMNDHSQAFVGDKYKDECDENEINNYIIKHLDYFKKKYSSFYLYVESKNINETFINFINVISTNIPILIELSSIDNTNLSLINRIINESNNKKIFIKNFTSNYTPDGLLCISNAKAHNKLVKYDWNHEQSKDLYMQDNFSIVENLDLLIKNTDDLKKVIAELNKIKLLFQQNLIDKITINIKVTDIRFFKVFGDILWNFEGSDNWPDEKITYNLNVDKIEEQINYRDTDRYKTISSKIQINSHGIHYDYYGEFQYFHNFTKFILSKIPENATELEKVVYISKFIIESFNYDDDNYEKLLDGTGETPIRNFYDFVSQGVGVCRDYANITEYLLNKIGIKCEYISSESYDYQSDKDIPGKIKYSDITGKIMDEKYFGHAFNLVYIDNKPYFLDNTWIDRGEKLSDSENFLVSTDTFMKTHGKYVEVKNYECLEDYSRYDISKAESMIEMFWFYYTDDDLRFLYSIGQNTIANKFTNSTSQKL